MTRPRNRLWTCDQCGADNLEPDDGPAIADDDVKLDHVPSVAECRSLRRRFKSEGFFPNVWHVNDHGNVDLLAIGHNGARIVRSWV